MSGYVAILTGRARATEDVHVLIETISEGVADRLVFALQDAGYWGPAMPLESLSEMLQQGDNIWIATDDQVTPHLEVKFPSDQYDTASLQNAVTATIGGSCIPDRSV